MEETYLFDPILTRTDVTVVKYFPKYILAGIGGFLHIFEEHSRKLTLKVEIFKDNKIQLIVPNSSNTKLLLCAGKQIKLVSTNNDFSKFETISAESLTDWVLAAKWINNESKIATVSMHNVLSVVSLDFKTELKIQCEEKCILYSAYICHHQIDNIVILSGTVFSEVLIWAPTKFVKDNLAVVQQRLKKHNGVIFSIDYSETLGLICSTSDDRSAILWSLKNKSLLEEKLEISEKCRVYGHQARIFRCKILNDVFITCGEDSLINIWKFNGELQRKIECSGGTVWSLDYTPQANALIVGTADCSLSTIKIDSPVLDKKIVLPNEDRPKHIGILNSSNLIIISEQANLYYFIKSAHQLININHFEDLESYVLLNVSHCRQLLALSGIKGQIYIYKDNTNNLLLKLSFVLPEQTRIFAFHWLDCSSFLICQGEGKLHLYNINDEIFHCNTFLLPQSRERWSTCACRTSDGSIVVGDRVGNIHLFNCSKSEPLVTIKKAHDHLGVSNISALGNHVTSLGRNGVIKQYDISKGSIRCTSMNKTPFSWLSEVINYKYLLAFSGKTFLVCDYTSKKIYFEKICGGGHRSWDFLFNTAVTTFVFVKDKVIHWSEFNLQDFLGSSYLQGFHIKNVNAMKVIKYGKYFTVISGGEDTILKVNKIDDNQFRQICSLKSHLSNIRAVDIHPLGNSTCDYLVFSAGGRAQIICWSLKISIKCSQQFTDLTELDSYYEEIDRQDSEMRIMALSTITIDNQVYLFCGCSDGNIKIFLIVSNSYKHKLVLSRTIFYRLNCITKVNTFYIDDRLFLVTMATDGKIVFWDISSFTKSNKDIFSPISEFQTHQSGINSCYFKIIDEQYVHFLTGGDDNAVILSKFKYEKTTGNFVRTNIFSDVSTHCAQVTGVYLDERYFFTSSVDQKVAVFQYECDKDILKCKLIQKYKTTVEDLQGLECLFSENGFDIFIYGNGLEYLKFSTGHC